MPVNAPPEFYDAMQKFREARDPKEKLKALEELWRVAPKHKGAQKLLLWIKKEIKKYRELLEKESRKKGSKKDIYNIKKEGDALVCLIGVENSGKSYILKEFTGLNIKSTEVPFETLEPATGIFKYNGARIQLVEIPSILDRKFCNIVRISDLLVIVINSKYDINDQVKRIREFFEKCNIVLNKKLPDIKIIRKYSGGIVVKGYEFVQDADRESIVQALKDLGYNNVEILIREKTDFKTLLDVLDGKISKKAIIFENWKMDLKKLKDEIWKNLDLIRVYTKSGSKIASEPVILKKNSCIKDLVERINKTWIKTFRYATLIRNGKRFRVGLDYKLEDLDIVEVKA